MRFKQYIDEAYVAVSRRRKDISIPIFVNPSTKEMRDCGKEHRFFVDVRNKHLYLWNWKLMHAEAQDILRDEGIEGHYSEHGLDEIWGESVLVGNKLKVTFIYRSAIYDILKGNPGKGPKFYQDLKFFVKWFGNSLIDEIIDELDD